MKLSFKRNPVSLYYLNEYCHSIPRIRIESTRGGDRCLWKARTQLKKMQETKRYLENVWKIKDN